MIFLCRYVEKNDSKKYIYIADQFMKRTTGTKD